MMEQATHHPIPLSSFSSFSLVSSFVPQITAVLRDKPQQQDCKGTWGRASSERVTDQPKRKKAARRCIYGEKTGRMHTLSPCCFLYLFGLHLPISHISHHHFSLTARFGGRDRATWGLERVGKWSVKMEGGRLDLPAPRNEITLSKGWQPGATVQVFFGPVSIFHNPYSIPLIWPSGYCNVSCR